MKNKNEPPYSLSKLIEDLEESDKQTVKALEAVLSSYKLGGSFSDPHAQRAKQLVLDLLERIKAK